MTSTNNFIGKLFHHHPNWQAKTLLHRIPHGLIFLAIIDLEKSFPVQNEYSTLFSKQQKTQKIQQWFQRNQTGQLLLSQNSLFLPEQQCYRQFFLTIRSHLQFFRRLR